MAKVIPVYYKKGSKMRITLESDYALRIVTALAEQPERMDAKSLSDKTGVTPRFTLKILHKLVHGGIVRSYKGTKGGYTLSKSADDVTLKEIIELIDGPIIIARCVESGEACALNHDKTACAYHHIFDTLSIDVARKLNAITISDVINKNFKL